MGRMFCNFEDFESFLHFLVHVDCCQGLHVLLSWGV